MPNRGPVSIGTAIQELTEKLMLNIAADRTVDRAFKKAIASRQAGDMSGYWNGIRTVWAQNMPAVLSGEPNPYFVDWTLIFTPIEDAVWGDIRCSGLNFFPQIPVGRRFVDFGNPIKKVGIECDGAAYHDVERDTARDLELREHGWTIYHLTGRECLEPDPEDYEDQESIDAWNGRSAYGLLKAIRQWHFQEECEDPIDYAGKQILNKHLLVGRID